MKVFRCFGWTPVMRASKQLRIVPCARVRWFSGFEKSNVYTRTGDKGTTVLFNMNRVPKTEDYFEALGDTDEVASLIGVAREHCRLADNGLDEYLEIIQCRLGDVGSQIATPRNSSPQAHLDRTGFSESFVTELEAWIDELDSGLPPLRNFILPSGGFSATALHVARPVVRRAERHMVPLAERGDIEKSVLQYMNRLSDFLFVSARYACHAEGREDAVYKRREAGSLKRTIR